VDRDLIEKFIILVQDECNKEDLIEKIIKFFKTHIELDAVGLRLREKDDYPYYTTIGFSDHFVKAENFLCKRDEKGNIIRDEKGKFILECMCGHVIENKIDCTKSCFTKHGSFVTDKKVDEITEDIAKMSCVIRGRCNMEGYKSVAIIPIKYIDEVIGLIQINSRKELAFSKNLIETVEEIAVFIGESLGNLISNEQIKEEKKKIIAENIKKIALNLQKTSQELLKKYNHN
jgi:hypothetical protein